MKEVTDRLVRGIEEQTLKANVYKPKFIRLLKEADWQLFKEILEVLGLEIYDSLHGQLAEYVKITNPAIKFSKEDLNEAVLKHIGEKSLIEYGVWVYYPWSKRLVHIPDEAEFIAIRTARNLYKITPEERSLLATKTIGVIGLSVGQSVALTIAMERICSEIRLADFDTLELSNLNRIRTGVHNLGLNKCVSVAREISEIDPFIKVTCFMDGATENNIDQFLTEPKPLDLLIEESDGMDIKVLSRLKARSYGIPVVMEASDKCLLDIERFDLDPQLGILHGILDKLDFATLKQLKTNEEKIPYMLEMAGVDKASERIRASMLEIEQTINTWPQLASAVTMGGGITADVSRRILLGQFTDSGRYRVDIEELIGNKEKRDEETEPEPTLLFTDIVRLTEEYVTEPINNVVNLTKAEAESIVHAASFAPSGGNSQPWVWTRKQNRLLLFNAVDANPIFLGYGNYGSYVAHGAAIENAVLMARTLHYDTNVKLFPDSEKEHLVAELYFESELAGNSEELELAKGIYTRHTNRFLSERSTIEPSKLEALKALVAKCQGAECRFFTDSKELDDIAEVLGDLEKVRLLEPKGQRDFSDEIRWTEEENQTRRDGLDLNTLDLTNSELAGLKIAKDKKVVALINEWNGGNAFKKLIKKSIDSASAVGIISIQGELPEDYVNGGRALQRLWIAANQQGIAFQPVSASLFLYERLLKGNGKGISEKGCETLWKIRPEFEKVFKIKPGQANILIFRLSQTPEPEVKSLRRDLSQVFINLENLEK
jgi:tRNA A37 threonylcarbamoyladenosine dehydratase/nitroreductase